MSAPTRTDLSDRADAGFAMVSVLFAAMLVSFFAYAVLAADRGAVADLAGQAHRARLEAAADAGLATALEALGRSGTDRWALDGRPHAFAVEGADVEARVEDERGKVPISYLTSEQARRLLSEAGASGASLQSLTASLMNWLDGEDRPEGARRFDYAKRGLRLRQGPLDSLGELTVLPGMTPELLARVAPLASVYAPRGGFDPAAATPAAVAIIGAAQAGAQDGSRPALYGRDLDYVGRPLRVAVRARDDGGGVYERAAIAVFTGRPDHPVYIRVLD